MASGQSFKFFFFCVTTTLFWKFYNFILANTTLVWKSLIGNPIMSFTEEE